MSSDSEGSYISELSDSNHEEQKLEEEESSVRIASSVCGTNVTSQIKSRGILTARFEYHFLGQNGSTSSAHKIFRFNPKNLKLRNRVFQTIYFSTVPKKNSCHMHFKVCGLQDQNRYELFIFTNQTTVLFLCSFVVCRY